MTTHDSLTNHQHAQIYRALRDRSEYCTQQLDSCIQHAPDKTDYWRAEILDAETLIEEIERRGLAFEPIACVGA